MLSFPNYNNIMSWRHRLHWPRRRPCSRASGIQRRSCDGRFERQWRDIRKKNDDDVRRLPVRRAHVTALVEFEWDRNKDYYTVFRRLCRVNGVKRVLNRPENSSCIYYRGRRERNNKIIALRPAEGADFITARDGIMYLRSSAVITILYLRVKT